MSTSRLLPMLCLSLVLVYVDGPPEAHAGDRIARGRYVRVELTAEHESIAPGDTTTLGLRFRLDAGWHLYWRNPGDAGEPPEVRWTLPTGATTGEIAWPTPIRIVEDPIVTFGYEGDLLLPVRLRLSEAYSGRELRIVADVSWLVCKDECIPGDATLELVLPVESGEAALYEADRQAFAETRRRLPHVLPPDALQATIGENALVLMLAANVARDLPEAGVTWEVFPQEAGVLAPLAAPDVERGPAGEVVLTCPLAKKRQDPPAHFAGILVARHAEGTRSFAVDAMVADAPLEPATDGDGGWRGKRVLAVALLGLFVGAMLGLLIRRRRPVDAAASGKE